MILISILRLSSYLQSLQLPKQSTSIPWKPVDNQPYSAEKEKLLKRTTCKKLGVLQLLSQCAWLQVFQGSYCLHCCHWVDCWLIPLPLLRWVPGSSFSLYCQHLMIVTAIAMPLSHCCSWIVAPSQWLLLQLHCHHWIVAPSPLLSPHHIVSMHHCCHVIVIDLAITMPLLQPAVTVSLSQHHCPHVIVVASSLLQMHCCHQSSCWSSMLSSSLLHCCCAVAIPLSLTYHYCHIFDCKQMLLALVQVLLLQL